MPRSTSFTSAGTMALLALVASLSILVMRTGTCTDENCIDVLSHCSFLAAEGQCSVRPTKLARYCPEACGLCSRNEIGLVNKMKQIVSGTRDEKAKIMEIVYDGKNHAESWGPNCANRDERCGKAAARGYCDGSMGHKASITCAPVCGTCDRQSRHDMEKACFDLVSYHPEEHRKDACKDIMALGPQRLDSAAPGAVYMDYVTLGRYNEPAFNVQLSQHPYAVQIFEIIAETPAILAVFICTGTIDGLTERNTLRIATANHCADTLAVPTSSLIVRVITASAVKEDDGNVGCLARVSKVHGSPLGPGKQHPDSDYATIELEQGRCVDSAKFAVDKWNGPGRVLDSLPKNSVSTSVLHQPWVSEGTFDCHPGDDDGKLGNLYFPGVLYPNLPDHLKTVLLPFLSYCRQGDALRPTENYEVLYKLHWGWARDSSGTLKMQLQRIPLAVWHHPCALGLKVKGEGFDRYPFNVICAEPLVNPRLHGEQDCDSGGGVLRYDYATKKYRLLGVLSQSFPGAAGSVLATPVDTHDNRI